MELDVIFNLFPPSLIILLVLEGRGWLLPWLPQTGALRARVVRAQLTALLQLIDQGRDQCLGETANLLGDRWMSNQWRMIRQPRVTDHQPMVTDQPMVDHDQPPVDDMA